ncbi:hypothetical protein HOY33_09260 [Brenneria sp. hezel4-2-4]|nr:hypothetical protein [Brenneria sp. hezel4-2-4]
MGNTISTFNKDLSSGSDGEYDQWTRTLPKVAPASSTTESAGGAGKGIDAALRNELSKPTGASLIEGIEKQRYKKRSMTFSTGGTVSRHYDVVLDEASGMWYQWMGKLPYCFPPFTTTPTQSFQGWLCRGFLSQWELNDPRNFGAHSCHETGFTDFDSTAAIQLLIDSVRLSLPNAGSNFSVQYTDRGAIDFYGHTYNISKPLKVQDDIASGYRCSGIRITNGGLRALSGFTPAIQVDNSGGDNVDISAFFIVGTKNYATQSGQYCGFVKIDNFTCDGNKFKVDVVVYVDVLAWSEFDSINCIDVKYGLNGKVLFLSSMTNWKLHNCNAIYYLDNTSIADGYNSGDGLEGGGNIISNILITGNGYNDRSISRIYQNRNGETNASNIISYNGLGDFLYIGADSAGVTGTKWSQFRGIEVGDIDGSIARIINSQYIEIDITAVKCGQKLKATSALIEVIGSSYVDIHPNIDQFYDLPSTWKEVISVTNSTGVNIHPGTIRSIPADDNLYPMIGFYGTSQRCNVMPLVSNIASYTKRYTRPIYSDSTCSAICVVGGSFPNGAFISGIPSLNGIGDSYHAVNTGAVAPIDSAKRQISLTNSNTTAATFIEKQIKLSTISVKGAELMTVSFNEASKIHNAIIDIDIIGTTAAGYGTYSKRVRAMFSRMSSSQGALQMLESDVLSATTNNSALSLKMAASHTQYSVSFTVIPEFSGTSSESTCNITALCRVSGEYGVSIS